VEQTLLIIKPNVTVTGNIGAVISAIEEHGFTIRAIRQELLDRGRAEDFYEIHRGKPFFDRLVDFMTSGPVVVLVLEEEDCVTRVRTVVGATDPAQAVEGTIRRRFGETVTKNAVHASDSVENAEREIQFFFGGHRPVVE